VLTPTTEKGHFLPGETGFNYKGMLGYCYAERTWTDCLFRGFTGHFLIISYSMLGVNKRTQQPNENRRSIDWYHLRMVSFTQWIQWPGSTNQINTRNSMWLWWYGEQR
jgi:hypothetical protein